MNLQDSSGTLVSSALFSGFVLHKDVLHLLGGREYWLRGANLHFLAPFLYVERYPENLLKITPGGLLPAVFAQPFEVGIDRVGNGAPDYNLTRFGLGFPISHRIPFGHRFRWVMLEGDEFVAFHRAREFEFLSRCQMRPEWHIKLTSQAYALECKSFAARDAFTAVFAKQFPDVTASEEKPDWINGFSVFGGSSDSDAEDGSCPRFRVKSIRKICDNEVDRSCLDELPPHLRPRAGVVGLGHEIDR